MQFITSTFLATFLSIGLSASIAMAQSAEQTETSLDTELLETECKQNVIEDVKSYREMLIQDYRTEMKSFYTQVVSDYSDRVAVQKDTLLYRIEYGSAVNEVKDQLKQPFVSQLQAHKKFVLRDLKALFQLKVDDAKKEFKHCEEITENFEL